MCTPQASAVHESTMDESDLLFRIFTNTIRMLRDRGYIVPAEFDPVVFTKDAFLTKYAR